MRVTHIPGASLLVALLLPLSTGCAGLMDGDDGPESSESSLSPLSCNAKALEVIVKGRENRFGLDGQQVALNASIPIDRICQRVLPSCAQACADAKATAVASGVRGFQDFDPVKLRKMGELADEFNAALGLDTNFSELGADGDDADAGALVCDAKALEVIVQGREHRFGFDGRQVALNAAIPMQNICQRVNSDCRATCDAARDAAIATGVRGFTGDDDDVKLRQMGQLADDFNAALGLQTNFKNLGAAAPPAGNGGAPQAACNAKLLQVVVKGREHRFGFDGRQVALNPGIPMSNICQSLRGECRSRCDGASAAASASGIKGFTGNDDATKLRQMGTLADGFNAALGNRSNFTDLPILLP